MSDKENQLNYLLEHGEIPLTKERVATQLSRTGSKFIVDVVDSDGFSKLHIKHNKRLFTSTGEDMLNAWVREKLGPSIIDIAHTEIVKKKAQSFMDHFGDRYKKNPNSFEVCHQDIQLIFDYANNQGTSTHDLALLLIDWRLG